MSKQTVVTARMPFIRAGHTEVGDGTCGLCDLVWPCDAGTVLMALADSEQRAAALETALGKAASRGLMIYHIASGHTGPAAFCEMTGCRLERRDMDKIAGPFLAASGGAGQPPQTEGVS